jgi:hypothetical protein
LDVRVLTKERARRLASRIDLDLAHTQICLACLSFVAIPLGAGDESEAERETVKFAPILWDERLERPLRLSLERAQERGLPDAAEALADIAARGGRTAIARAAVQRLALQLSLLARAAWN